MRMQSRKNIFVRTGIILLALLIFIVVALVVAGTAMNHQAETAAFNKWLYAGRFGWLAWRLVLYTVLGWGVWKIHKAPGFRTEYRRPLRRMMVISVMFVLLCEYALFSQAGD